MCADYMEGIGKVHKTQIQCECANKTCSSNCDIIRRNLPPLTTIPTRSCSHLHFPLHNQLNRFFFVRAFSRGKVLIGQLFTQWANSTVVQQYFLCCRFFHYLFSVKQNQLTAAVIFQLHPNWTTVTNLEK